MPLFDRFRKKKEAKEAEKPPAPPPRPAPEPRAAPRPAAPRPGPGAVAAGPAEIKLDDIKSALDKISSVLGADEHKKQGGEDAGCNIALPLIEVLNLLPPEYVAEASRPQETEERVSIAIPDLFDQLMHGKVCTTVPDIIRGLSADYLRVGAMEDKGTSVELPLPLVVAAVDPQELMRRTTQKPGRYNVDHLPNPFARTQAAKTTVAVEEAEAAEAGPAEVAEIAEAVPAEEQPAAPAVAEGAAPAPAPVEIVEVPPAAVPAAMPPIQEEAALPQPAPVEAEAVPAPAPAAVVEIPPPSAAMPFAVPVVEEEAPAPVVVEETRAALAPAPLSEVAGQAAPAEAPLAIEATEAVQSVETAQPRLPPVEQPIVTAPSPAVEQSEQREEVPAQEEEEEEEEAEEEKAEEGRKPAVQEEAPAVPALAAPEPIPQPEEVAESPLKRACGINLNTATIEQLMQLQGVDRRIASAIVTHREEHGPFRNIFSLRDVRAVNRKVFRYITGMPWSRTGRERQDKLAKLLGLNKDQIGRMRAIATAFAGRHGFDGCIICDRDGFLLAQGHADKYSQTLSAVAPQIFKKLGEYLVSVDLADIDAATFYPGGQPMTFVRSGEVFLVAIHEARRLNKTQIRFAQRVVEELDWLLGRRGYIGMLPSS